MRGVEFRRGSPFIIFRAVISPRATRNHLLNGSIPPSPLLLPPFREWFDSRSGISVASSPLKRSLQFILVYTFHGLWEISNDDRSYYPPFLFLRIEEEKEYQTINIVIEILNFALSHHSNRSNLFSKIFIILDCFFYLKLELFFRVNPSLAILRMEILFLKFRKHY